jgi:pimeloyl-ACP methyl ester carboxylesterase
MKTALVWIMLAAWPAAGGAAPAQPIKNIVLVHGAFADGSSWAKVIPILQAKGYNVTAVQNPLTSLADDVAATHRALEQQGGPVILVGHSWAGVVITEAGMDPKVVGLVYVAAFGPDRGEAVGELGKAAIAPDEERFFAKRMKATTTELNTSHVPMLSQPKAVATVIMDAAAKAMDASGAGVPHITNPRRP